MTFFRPRDVLSADMLLYDNPTVSGNGEIQFPENIII
jgi:hypothetical protein